jgi:spore germination cell wall hydrolase CwlJ-like protein
MATYWLFKGNEMKLNVKRPNALAEWSSRIIKLMGLFFVILAVWTVCQSRLDALKSDRAAGMAGYVSAEDRLKQLDCLTRNIYWEAASEPFEGKVAVAQVTLNRVESGRFAPTVCGVVYQKNVFYERVVCQFSWLCENTHKTRAVHQPMWQESELVAKKVLLENFRLPGMKNALYYHADYVNPNWRKPRIEKIGHHIFYGERS